MGGSRIFDWGGPRIDKVWDAGQNVAIFALKSWPIGGGAMALWPPPLWNRPCIIIIVLYILYTVVVDKCFVLLFFGRVKVLHIQRRGKTLSNDRLGIFFVCRFVGL